MKKKVWLARNMWGKYELHEQKPVLNYASTWNSQTEIIKGLCPSLIKRWFSLRRNIKRETCVQGYFDVSFKPVKREK